MRGDKSADSVSRTGDGQFGQLTDGSSDRRTVGEIQRKVIKRSKRNAVSRFVHAKNDKEIIAGWGLGPNRILRVFNVCSAACVLLDDRQPSPPRPSWP